jgi:hypothetical protein
MGQLLKGRVAQIDIPVCLACLFAVAASKDPVRHQMVWFGRSSNMFECNKNELLLYPVKAVAELHAAHANDLRSAGGAMHERMQPFTGGFYQGILEHIASRDDSDCSGMRGVLCAVHAVQPACKTRSEPNPQPCERAHRCRKR